MQIDWKKVEKGVNKAKRQIKKRSNKAAPEINNIPAEAAEAVKQNIVIPSALGEGLLWAPHLTDVRVSVTTWSHL